MTLQDTQATLVRGADGVLYEISKGASRQIPEEGTTRFEDSQRMTLGEMKADAKSGAYTITPEDHDSGAYTITPDQHAGAYTITPDDHDAGAYTITPDHSAGAYTITPDQTAGNYTIEPGPSA